MERERERERREREPERGRDLVSNYIPSSLHLVKGVGR